MNIEHKQLKHIKENVGSSFYIFLPKQFEENYKNFLQSFQKYYLKSEVAYAYKANYMPILGDIIAQQNGMIEVASRLEYDIALKSIAGERIIFNGPMKTKDDLYTAITNSSIVNIDSFYELEFIKDLLNDKKIKNASIGIRINYTLPGHTSRFGFDLENGEFEKALKIIESEERINLIGIHSHFTTKQRCLKTFSIRAKKMAEVFNNLQHKHDIRYVDIGGGFFGGLTPELAEKYGIYVPSIDEYAQTITSSFMDTIKTNKKPTLIIEPGISITANVMHLFAEILEIKKIGNKHIAVCDTSINIVNPEKSKIAPSYNIIHSNKSTSNKTYKYTIVGHTCLEYDIVIENHLGHLKKGDFVMFINKGAYSHVRTPIFIMPPPPIVSLDGKVFKKRDSADTVLENYEYKNKHFSKV